MTYVRHTEVPSRDVFRGKTFAYLLRFTELRQLCEHIQHDVYFSHMRFIFGLTYSQEPLSKRARLCTPANRRRCPWLVKPINEFPVRQIFTSRSVAQVSSVSDPVPVRWLAASRVLYGIEGIWCRTILRSTGTQGIALTTFCPSFVSKARSSGGTVSCSSSGVFHQT